MIASQISVSADLDWYSQTRQAISAGNGYNVSFGMHHGVVKQSAMWTADKDYDKVIVVQHGWAATNGAPPSSLTLEQRGYGQFQVFKF
jgi:phage-related protein